MSECKLCQEREVDWTGEEPVCAFPEGKYVARNWNCATMNELRIHAIRNGTIYWRDQESGGHFGLIRFEGGYLVMTWYPEPDTPAQALLLWDHPDDRGEPILAELTESTAVQLASEYKAGRLDIEMLAEDS